MKKIIAAFDSLKYSESTQKYAIDIARETNAHLVGVFLDDYSYHSYRIYEVVANGGISEEQWDMLDEQDRETRTASVTKFDEACRHAGLQFSIHRDRNIAIRELLHESIYADLLIIDRKESLSTQEGKIPSSFMRDLLIDIQCPVLVVPENFHKTEKIVLLYDGSPASVFAIRSFSYLFPALKRLPVEVVTVKPERDDLHVPDNKLMREFMKWHFPDAGYYVLKGSASFQITTYLSHHPLHTLLVMGAYQRSRVSRWFHPSLADTLLENTRGALFIAHK